MGWEKRRQEIKEKHIAQTGKRALLVEGSNDDTLFRILLSRRFGGAWENTWVLTEVSNKKTVTDILEHEPNWFGIVDRDEWSADIIAKIQGQLGNLFVLPRFCLESYAVYPDELWTALPKKMQQKVTGGIKTLWTEIMQDKEKWLRHGVLWSEVNPLWSGLRSLGFKERLLDFDAAQDDDIIMNTLKEWHKYLTPDQIFHRFNESLEQVLALPPREQYHEWIHGKLFFANRVHLVLNKHLGQLKVRDRMKEIFRTLALPEDLEPLWALIQPE